jgi:hypothetical protein
MSERTLHLPPVNRAELAAILAGLRLYEAMIHPMIEACGGDDPDAADLREYPIGLRDVLADHEETTDADAILDVASDGGSFVPLGAEPVDALCGYINSPGDDATMSLLRRLKEWGAATGGWEAPIWREVELALAKDDAERVEIINGVAPLEGWGLFEFGDRHIAICNDDEADAFPDGIAAYAHCEARAAEGSAIHREAIAIHNATAPKNEEG